MRKEHLIVLLVIMLAIIPYGCTKKEKDNPSGLAYTKLEDVNGFRCSDGRLVTDAKYCVEVEVVEKMAIDPADPDLEIEPEKVSIGKTGFTVNSAEEAKSAFEGYVENRKLDYMVVSTEEIDSEDGIKYYRVRYSHNGKSGGRRNMIGDSDGNVFLEVGLA